MILIDAVYINESGGKVLLEILVDALIARAQQPLFFLFDKRCAGNLHLKTMPEKNVVYLESSYSERLAFYKMRRNDFSKVFCFANVPPPLRLSCPVITYFHSFMLDIPVGTSLKSRSVLLLKKLIIKRLRKNTDKWFVQSGNMATLVSGQLSVKNADIEEFPFYKQLYCNTNIERIQSSFIYMSNGYEHKNHKRLLEAWEVLYAKGYSVPLTLTIKERFHSLIAEIKRLQTKGLNIINLGWVDNVSDELSRHQFQIYPSLTESFGLGLIEAVDCGCEVIAPQKAYVDAVIEPLTYIDPFSVESIVDTVLHAMELPLGGLLQSKIKTKNRLQELAEEILK